MKLEKAIEIIKEDLHHLQCERSPDVNDALKLGIEALDYLQRERRANPGVAYTCLNGEDWPMPKKVPRYSDPSYPPGKVGSAIPKRKPRMSASSTLLNPNLRRKPRLGDQLPLHSFNLPIY